MAKLIQQFSINSNATKANPVTLTVTINSELVGLYSVSPNPIIVWLIDTTQTQTFQKRYYWVPLGTTLDDTQYFVGVAGGQSAATTQALVEDMS